MDITICKFSVDFEDKKSQVYEVYGEIDSNNKKQIKLKWRLGGFWKTENVKCYNVIEQAISNISSSYIGRCFEDINTFSDLRSDLKIKLIELFSGELKGKNGRLIGSL